MKETMATDEALIEHIIRTIVERFNPRRIVLFGSRARGDAGPDSDLDFFVEMETSDRRESAVTISSAFGLHEWAMDIVVYTPEYVAQWTGQVGTILYDVEREGKVLYDRRGTVAVSATNPPYPP